jgi:N6-adenosine-specific RNA methylase IME4
VSRYVTFEEEVAFKRSRGSHKEIDSERQEEMMHSPPHPPTIQRETVEPIDPFDLVDPLAPVDFPTDIFVGQKRPTWACQTLQEEK